MQKKVSSEELAKAALAGKNAVVGVVKAPLKKDDAIKIAEAHLVKIYGKKVLERRDSQIKVREKLYPKKAK
ncbi:MAG: hypothetical protein R3Y46_07105 [Opitutales bacterium]